MIILFVLYNLFLYGDVLAGPLQPPLQSTEETSFYPRKIDPNRLTQRSEWNIIRSCYATLFACSWVAIHPNIAAPSDSIIRIFVRRLMMMGYMLVVPEFMIFWAGRQWSAAFDIAKAYKHREWTTTHGFFVLMGGFMLYENGVKIETLGIKRLEQLASVGKIDWPTISQEEIQDKSKGDFISKGFVVLQTSWFIVQCIARGFAGLSLTELEVATLAFAALNGILYTLWWNKPLDVSCPVAVHLRHPTTLDTTRLSSKHEAGTQTVDLEYGETLDHDIFPIPSDSFYRTSDLSLDDGGLDHEDDSLGTTSQIESTPSEREAEIQTMDLEDGEMPDHDIFPIFSDSFYRTLDLSLDDVGLNHEDDPLRATNQIESTPSELLSSTPFQRPSIFVRFRAYFSRQAKDRGFVRALIYILIVKPLRVFWLPINTMAGWDSTPVDDTPSLSVPTFYAPSSSMDGLGGLIAMGVGILFGGIHCIAWSFTFPSATEKLFWRISAVTLAAIPVAFTFLVFLVVLGKRGSLNWMINSVKSCFGYLHLNINNFTRPLIGWTAAVGLAAYFFSRFTLLILPLIALRSLPPNSLLDIKWSSFIPHI